MERETPDLVIGRNLNAAEILELMSPKISEVEPSQPEDALLLPLAYELPLIMGKSNVMASLSDPSTITLEELFSVAEPYTQRDRSERLSRVGFSPSWNPSSYTDMLAIRAPGIFSSGVQGADEKRLNEIVNEAREWIEAGSGGVEADQEFIKRYRYMPDEKLIADGRILFARTDFDSWTKLPDSTSSNLDIRYLKGPRTIPLVDVTSLAVPRKGKSDKAALLFAQWLLKDETQSRLIQRWEQEGLPVFGFLGGLSTNQRVNETTLLNHFPNMEGMIPESNYLSSRVLLPQRWKRIRSEVIQPWFADALVNPEAAGTLADRYRSWDLSSLDESD